MMLPIIVSSRQEASCGRKDCDPAEQPEHWVDTELDQPLKDAISEAMAALVGYSNDAEHNALVGLIESFGYGQAPECNCGGGDLEELHSADCACTKWRNQK